MIVNFDLNDFGTDAPTTTPPPALICDGCQRRWRWWHEVFGHPCGHTRSMGCFFSEPPDAPASIFLCGCDDCGDETNQ